MNECKCPCKKAITTIRDQDKTTWDRTRQNHASDIKGRVERSEAEDRET